MKTSISKSPIPRPVALFPSYDELLNIDMRDYPELSEFITTGPSWFKQHWDWGQEFLCYIGRNKSEHTFGRFRNETERFLLWALLIKETPIDQMRKADILEYADFCWKPPVSWICITNHEKFSLHNGVFVQNKAWSPFRIKLPKSAPKDEKPDKKNTSHHSKHWPRCLPVLRLFIST